MQNPSPGNNTERLRPTAAVVPAAGLGTRLRPLTAGALPKEMLPVGRYLALERIVEELEAAGISRIVFVVSPVKEALLRAHFGEGNGNVSFAFALQSEMRGLGDAVLKAEPFMESGEPIVVALGDAVFEERNAGDLTRRLVDAFEAHEAGVGLAVRRVARERISRYGVVRPVEAPTADVPFPIDGIVEKPAPEDAPSEYAANARYVLDARVFDFLRRTPPGKGGEIQLTDAIAEMLNAGIAGIAAPLRQDETRHDLGSLDTYFRAFVAFALRDPDEGAGLREWLDNRLREAAEHKENAGA